MSTENALKLSSNGKFTPNNMGTDASEKAWTMRCGAQNGGGYTLSFDSSGLGGGNSSYMRYSKSCEPASGISMSGGAHCKSKMSKRSVFNA